MSFTSRVVVSVLSCTRIKYRAKNDINNALSAGFISGAVLARNSGPRAAIAGGLAFAAFSGAIDLFIRREPAEYVHLPFLLALTCLIHLCSED